MRPLAALDLNEIHICVWSQWVLSENFIFIVAKGHNIFFLAARTCTILINLLKVYQNYLRPLAALDLNDIHICVWSQWVLSKKFIFIVAKGHIKFFFVSRTWYLLITDGCHFLKLINKNFTKIICGPWPHLILMKFIYVSDLNEFFPKFHFHCGQRPQPPPPPPHMIPVWM